MSWQMNLPIVVQFCLPVHNPAAGKSKRQSAADVIAFREICAAHRQKN